MKKKVSFEAEGEWKRKGAGEKKRKINDNKCRRFMKGKLEKQYVHG